MGWLAVIVFVVCGLAVGALVLWELRAQRENEPGSGRSGQHLVTIRNRRDTLPGVTEWADLELERLIARKHAEGERVAALAREHGYSRSSAGTRERLSR